jgi:hypothetical protein
LSERLADEPLAAIANDGGAHLARGDDPEPRFSGFFPGELQEDEVRSRSAAPAFLNSLVLAPLTDALKCGKAAKGASARHYFW